MPQCPLSWDCEPPYSTKELWRICNSVPDRENVNMMLLRRNCDVSALVHVIVGLWTITPFHRRCGKYATVCIILWTALIYTKNVMNVYHSARDLRTVNHDKFTQEMWQMCHIVHLSSEYEAPYFTQGMWWMNTIVHVNFGLWTMTILHKQCEEYATVHIVIFGLWTMTRWLKKCEEYATVFRLWTPIVLHNTCYK